jgi:hypothetical protein
VGSLVKKQDNQLFRINLAQYYLIDDNGSNKKITPRPKILFDNSALVIVSKLDKKIYNFTGINASETKREAAAVIAKNLSTRLSYELEKIELPADDIAPEYLQFIDFFVDDYYFPKKTVDITKYYKCYFCGKPLKANNGNCAKCNKKIYYCFVCNMPILFGDTIGKCSLCGEVAHIVHFQEWLKALGMCPKCNEKLTIEEIIPITEDNKNTFFKD